MLCSEFLGTLISFIHSLPSLKSMNDFDSLVELLKQQDYSTYDLEALFTTLLEFDFTKADLQQYIPEVKDPHNYARNILCLEPIEVVVLAWPARSSSAIHFHQGFWGVVAVAEGRLDNVTFTHQDGVVTESNMECGLAGALIKESDGVIHLLKNPTDELAITVHFYYPPLADFDGMEIYDLSTETIGVLNDTAESASWSEPRTSFKEIKKKAFKYEALEKRKDAPSHRIHPLIPKPGADENTELLTSYYREQAANYDHYDTNHESRRLYTSRINRLIADDLSKTQMANYLAIACGTGRRAMEIRALSGMHFNLFGVDISSEMGAIAKKRGISTQSSTWLNAEVEERSMDAVSFLYAFGHISSAAERAVSLTKISKCLQVGGRLYLDVFNVIDRFEWGPRAVGVYEQLDLQRMGYEKGDVFYRKTGGKSIAYLHYFAENEITELLNESGFKIISLTHVGYTKHPGEILSQPDEGSIFIIAEKAE